MVEPRPAIAGEFAAAADRHAAGSRCDRRRRFAAVDFGSPVAVFAHASLLLVVRPARRVTDRLGWWRGRGSKPRGAGVSRRCPRGLIATPERETPGTAFAGRAFGTSWRRHRARRCALRGICRFRGQSTRWYSRQL